MWIQVEKEEEEEEEQKVVSRRKKLRPRECFDDSFEGAPVTLHFEHLSDERRSDLLVLQRLHRVRLIP